jgi:hypothetical protein
VRARTADADAVLLQCPGQVGAVVRSGIWVQGCARQKSSLS